MDFGLATEYFSEEQGYAHDSYETSFLPPDLLIALQSMHGHLQPEKVCDCYGQILQQHLPVIGVKICLEEQSFRWGSEQGLTLMSSLLIGSVKSTVIYFLSFQLTETECSKLQQLSELLQQPLFNALLFQKMSQRAMLDDLTQLGNRHFYNNCINKAIARAQRQEVSTSLIMLDLDDFKQLNDAFGHIFGDKVLQLFGKLLLNSVRDVDRVFRIGGDEFIILVDGDLTAARTICRRIAQRLNQHALLKKHRVRTSWGIAQWCTGQDAEQLYGNADSALYEGKASSRQCVI